MLHVSPCLSAFCLATRLACETSTDPRSSALNMLQQSKDCVQRADDNQLRFRPSQNLLLKRRSRGKSNHQECHPIWYPLQYRLVASRLLRRRSSHTRYIDTFSLHTPKKALPACPQSVIGDVGRYNVARIVPLFCKRINCTASASSSPNAKIW